MIVNRRTQFPVGQGFFHTGFVSLDEQCLMYVYDCGSKGQYKSDLSREIDRFRSWCGDRRKIDALFVSHLHDDHVNGLDRLLAEMKVDVVFLPYLTDIDRIFMLVEIAERGALDSTTIELVSNPTEWFASRDAHRIVYVYRARRGDFPSLPVPTLPRAEESKSVEGLPSEAHEGPTLALNLKGTERKHPTFAGGPLGYATLESRGQGQVVWMPDTSAVPVSWETSASPKREVANWVFIMFAHPCDDRNRLREFERKVKKEFPELWTQGIAGRRLNDEELRRILRDTADYRKLEGYYRDWGYEGNGASMSLYAGPIRWDSEFNGALTDCRQPESALTWREQYRSGPCGWLGTGDAPLHSGSRRAAFLTHYQPVRHLVHTLALPHHGSRAGFHEQLLLPSVRTCVASAGASYRYGHPHHDVKMHVEAKRLTLHVVTEDEATAFHERCCLGYPTALDGPS